MTGQQFAVGIQITLIPQPVYSPHLAPGDFWLFPSLKWGFWVYVLTLQDIICKATASLCTIQNEAFHNCFQEWQNCCSKCMCVQKGYTSRMIRLENTVLQVLKFYGLILGTFWETWYFICYHKALTVLFVIFFTYSAHYIKKEVWPNILNYSINVQMFCRAGTMWKRYYNDTQTPSEFQDLEWFHLIDFH
jgi:hypothetical protein